MTQLELLPYECLVCKKIFLSYFEIVDDHDKELIRKTYDDDSSWTPLDGPWCFDGKYYLYNGGDTTRRVNLFDNTKYDFTPPNYSRETEHTSHRYIRARNRKEYIYWISPETNGAGTLKNHYLAKSISQSLLSS